jgi:ATP-dependent exoDNAse (exonuclease V) alpha subunit
MTVQTDDGRSIAFDLKDYNRIDHGYAATIHKAQGMTVDRTHVLATPGMDAHGSYVALSRHRDGMDLHYGRDDFASQDKLINTLSRDRAKDMATDYEQQITRRRATPNGAVLPPMTVMLPLNRRASPSNAVDRIGDIIFSVREPP